MLKLPREFWIWAAWRDEGGIPALRPAGLPAKIPAAWWARYLIHKGIKPAQPILTRNVLPAQFILFAASDPLAALAAPFRYGVALSADLNHPEWATQEIVDALHFKGHRVFAWSDCDATPAGAAIALWLRFGLDGWIGQAENPDQFDNAYDAGARVIVGNRSSLTADQIETLDKARAANQLLWIQEDFWNEGWALDRSACDAVMHGIYPALWNPTIKAYKDAGRWAFGDGLFHVSAVQDWESLP